MVFGWFKEHQRQSILAHPFPPAWEEYLRQNVHFYARLSSFDQAKLRDTLRILIAEKSWEGCGGQEVDEEVQVTIAGQAALLLVGMPHDYFPNVETILVYPTAYKAPARQVDPFATGFGAIGTVGIVTESTSARLGESWGQGPVILSWQDALAGGRNETDGHNLVLHEFAHKLDTRDNNADGVPRLPDQAAYDNWAEVMTSEYQALLEDTRHGHHTLLNSYAVTNGAEFFAVATECFFEKAAAMQRSHPRLYSALSGFYRQDPASWS